MTHSCFSGVIYTTESELGGLADDTTEPKLRGVIDNIKSKRGSVIDTAESKSVMSLTLLSQLKTLLGQF
jgi:hypothetical protein